MTVLGTQRSSTIIEAWALTLDNFEGVEVRQDKHGRTLVYLLSDDNNCAKTVAVARRGVQRTLLLLFVLAG